MLLFDRATPRQCVRWSLRVLYVSAPLSLMVLLAWAFVDALHPRPYLVVMVYLLLLALSTGAGVVAALGSCHMAIGRAFSAGVHVGRQTGEVVGKVHLRAVE